MARWLSPGGIEVEHIIREGRPCLRVSHRVNGQLYHVADCWSPAQVAMHVDLASLIEVVDLEKVRRRHRATK
ncbi:transposase [Nonomuraea dietziae]|uniref:transposase n=1 Tax=Nonomuraea dietziae TaxID=65515 RepID=UPI0034356CC2